MALQSTCLPMAPYKHSATHCQLTCTPGRRAAWAQGWCSRRGWCGRALQRASAWCRARWAARRWTAGCPTPTCTSTWCGRARSAMCAVSGQAGNPLHEHMGRPAPPCAPLCTLNSTQTLIKPQSRSSAPCPLTRYPSRHRLLGCRGKQQTILAQVRRTEDALRAAPGNATLRMLLWYQVRALLPAHALLPWAHALSCTDRMCSAHTCKSGRQAELLMTEESLGSGGVVTGDFKNVSCAGGVRCRHGRACRRAARQIRRHGGCVKVHAPACSLSLTTCWNASSAWATSLLAGECMCRGAPQLCKAKIGAA